MRELNEDELAELVASQQRLTISGFAVVGLLLVGIVVYVMAAPDDASSGPIPLYAGVGILLGRLLKIPQNSLIKRLGLTRVEAIQILADEKQRRSPRPVLSVDLIKRKQAIWYVVAAACFIVVVIALAYAIPAGSRPYVEGSPTNPWFATAVVAVPVGAIAGFLALITGQGYGLAARVRGSSISPSRSTGSTSTRPLP